MALHLLGHEKPQFVLGDARGHDRDFGGIDLGLGEGRKQADVADQPVAPQGARRALLEGVVVEALNVKTALFFLAFLPQFVAPAEPLVPQLVLLGSICVALNTLVDVVAVLAAHRLLASGVVRAARARLMTRVSGITMIGLGVFLATAKRQA
jgi:threonine/homoserine/homoserine lactone efflux protein